MAEKRSEVGRTEEKGLARREGTQAGGPFQLLERFTEEVDRVFDDFGFGRRWLSPRLGLGVSRPLFGRAEAWFPDIEVFHRNNELVVRADLPGLSKDDVKIDITDDALTIQGERKREHEEEKGGIYRSERSYGSFSRVIALPEGAMTDQAKAVFKDGVLEVAMPAPPESVKHGRRIEITEPAIQKK